MISQRDMLKAMQKLGIKQAEIPAKEVIIKSEGKDYLIRNPKVSRISMMGQDTIQVIGNIEEKEHGIGLTDEDIAAVIEQSGCTKEEAAKALAETWGDIAEAIIKLQSRYNEGHK